MDGNVGDIHEAIRIKAAQALMYEATQNRNKGPKKSAQKFENPGKRRKAVGFMRKEDGEMKVASNSIHRSTTEISNEKSKHKANAVQTEGEHRGKAESTVEESKLRVGGIKEDLQIEENLNLFVETLR